jgi:phage shock protein E
VRSETDFRDSHIEHAIINIDFNSGSFAEEVDRFDKSKIYLVSCRSGSCSTAAGGIMRELGFLYLNNFTA